MHTQLADFIKGTAEGEEAASILGKCVHCGFCTATCPTYQLLGDELDGPRGRIYLIKQMLEGDEVTEKTQLHLDRCLSCRSCETTCPSGVRYSRLLEIGRSVVDTKVKRPLAETLKRAALNQILPHPNLFAPVLAAGRLSKPLLSKTLQGNVPDKVAPTAWPEPVHSRRMLVHQGCVQRSIAPQINAAAARVLDKLGISLVRVTDSACCGAVNLHLNARKSAKQLMRRNIDTLLRQLDKAELLIGTASACTLMFKEYGEVLADDENYRSKAAEIASRTRDLAQVVADEDLSQLGVTGVQQKVAFHSPCTLQHGQKLTGVVEKILRDVGYDLCLVNDAHICCGSAGTYSILQAELSQRLRGNKITNLTRAKPQCIATANIGCLTHLAPASDLPVVHWIQLLDPSAQQSG